MTSVKRDQIKQSWEDTEFPLVCETCLGDNPYVRMTKEAHGKKCQICENPFTVFAWQAGTKGRLKKVEICRNCAQAKNVCQVCIYDLQYGLPVKVRDKVLQQAGNSNSTALTAAVPQSMANRAWHTAQQQRMISQGEHQPEIDQLAHAQLSEMARMEPRYERNMAKLCSFFARGECNRGVNCPFRHEKPRDRNDSMAAQSTKNRFYGTSDPVANKILGRKRRQDEVAAKEQDTFEKARATLYMRFQGDGPYPELTELDVRDQFYAYGEIVSIRIQVEKGQAFVEYTQPEACELAIASMNKKMLLNRQLFVAWARANKRGDDNKQARHGENTVQQQRQSDTVKLVAPPGGGGTSTSQLKKILPKIKAKPAPEVAAMIAAKKQNGGGMTNDKSSFYPSADPERLGTKSG